MTRSNKDKGTEAETGVVKLAHEMGFKGASRAPLAGANDIGDIIGIDGICIEVKDVKDPKMKEYFLQTLKEARQKKDSLPVLVMRVFRKNSRQWDAYIPLHWVEYDLRGIPMIPDEDVVWIRMDLEHAFDYMKRLAYR